MEKLKKYNVVQLRNGDFARAEVHLSGWLLIIGIAVDPKQKFKISEGIPIGKINFWNEQGKHFRDKQKDIVALFKLKSVKNT